MRTLTCQLLLCMLAALPAQTRPMPPVQGVPPGDLTQEEIFRIVEARRAVRQDFFDPSSHVALALAYHDAGATVMAFRLLRSAQTRYFRAREFLTAYHTAFHGEVPERILMTGEASLAAARERTEADPENADEWREYGRRLAASGASAEAQVALRRAYDLAPAHGANAAALAGVMAAGGDTEGAIELLEAFVASHPEDDDARVQLADTLRRGSPEAQVKARGLIRKGLELNPESHKLHLGMAYLLSTAEHAPAAAHHYRKAVEFDPENPVVLAWYGRSLLVDSKDKAAALEVYLKCWFLDPTARESSPVYERVTSLIEDGAAEVLAAVQGERGAFALFDSWNPQVALGSWSLAMPQSSYSKPLIQMALNHLAHDDEAVRYQAALYLGSHASQADHERLAALFDHEDVFVRGLACYIGITRWGHTVSADLEHALDSKNEYLRYEAYSALLKVGKAWGRRLFDERMQLETSKRLRELIKPR